MRPGYRILSIDGGGVRGIIASRLLERLERERSHFLDRFDLVAGTSTGGIIALAIAAGIAPDRISEMYMERAPSIFPRDLGDKLGPVDKLFRADYPNTGLRECLSEVFGDLTLGDLDARRILIATVEFGAGGTPRFFHNFGQQQSGDKDELLVDIAMRACAAPTYFPIYQGYVDGGILANNPSVCAVTHALDPGLGAQTLERISLLSVGTGTCPRPPEPLSEVSWGLAQWVPRLLAIAFEGGACLSDYECSRMLGARYQRLNPLLDDRIELDDVEAVPLLAEVADAVDLAPALEWFDRYEQRPGVLKEFGARFVRRESPREATRVH